jgi:hypothetical protein
VIRASVAAAPQINEWVWRDSGKRGDLGPFLADRMNVCLIEGEGGAIFVWRGPGIYETHCFFEQRGKEVREISRRFLDHMREEFGARLIWAAIPDESRRVKIYVRWLGFKSVEKRNVTNIGPAELFILEM